MGVSQIRSGRPAVFGVLYAEDFDESDAPGPYTPGPPAEPELIEPVFTLAELDAARAQGRDAGRVEAEQGLAGTRTRLLYSLTDLAHATRGEALAIAEAAAEDAARCMLGALAGCLPALCERHGPGELRALMRAILPALSEEPRIVVRINPLMMPVLQGELASLDAEIAERVHLLATEAMPPGDMRVTWAEGSAVRDAGRARAAFETALAELGLLQRENADA